MSGRPEGAGERADGAPENVVLVTVDSRGGVSATAEGELESRLAAPGYR